MNARRPIASQALLIALLAAVIAATMALTWPEDSHAWVTCPDGTMADHGACPGPQGPRGPRGHAGPQGEPGESIQGPQGEQGLQGERGPRGYRGYTGTAGVVKSDWAAMALAATGIRFTDDPVSMGLGLGHAGGADAIALGIRLDRPRVRIHGNLMRSLDGESGASIGMAWGW